MSRWQLYLKIKNIDTDNAMFIVWCLIFAYFIFCIAEGETVEKTNVFATVVLAVAAYLFQRNTKKANSTKNRQEDIINSCKLIRSSFLDTREVNSDGCVVQSRVDEDGIQILNQEKRYVYFEFDFNCNKTKDECTLYVTIKNLKGDDREKYEEPYWLIHYISTATTNAVEILNVEKSNEYVEETEGYLNISPVAVEKIGNYEWNQIRAVLANILTSYAMKKEE